MIIRRFVVLFCSSAYLTATNGLYLNFAVPKAKALETLQSEDAPHRDIDKWIRKGRTYHKKLIILDRKNKRVDDFVKKLINVIENDANKNKLLNEDKRIVCRHMSFGSIYNSKAKRKRCKNPTHKRKQPWINFVIPIPIKKNIFSDGARQGFSEDYLIDFNRRTDIDFDYYNTVHRAHADSKPKDNDKGTANTRIVVANAGNEAPVPLRRMTRFKIVPDNGGKPKGPTRSGSDNDDDTDDDSNSDDEEDSDVEKEEERKGPVKKIKDEWNDIIKMVQVVKDSSEERKKRKQKKPTLSDKSDENKNNAEDYKEIEALHDTSGGDYAHSSEKEIKVTKPPELTEAQKKKKKWEEERKKIIDDAWNLPDIGTSEERLRKKDKRKISETSGEEDSGDAEDIDDGNEKDSHNEKYVYMQGHRLYNSNLDSVESRKMRIKNHFLPKKSIWDENAIKHLGAYWNSHELAGHN